MVRILVLPDGRQADYTVCTMYLGIGSWRPGGKRSLKVNCTVSFILPSTSA